MYHHSIALALAEARIADMQKADSESTASPRRRRRLRALVLGLTATAAVAPTAALAQPMHDGATPAKAQAAVDRHHEPSATRPSITFTNPLGRSRGPGAGAGLL
jgi:hypothetical protein